MFGNFEVADIVAYHCSKIDILCRKELQRNTLVSERDYVSTFTTRIRDDLKLQLNMPCHSQTIFAKYEKEVGVDSIMLFKWRDEIKVGIFEAKRPQVAKEDFPWDYMSKRGISHFSEQVTNQQKWKDDFAIWEMFINEEPSGSQSPPFDFFGSSCVWHKNTYDFMHEEELIFNSWTTEKLKALLSKNGTNLYSIIYDIISCRAGKKAKYNMNDSTCTFYNSNNSNIAMEIPLPNEFGNVEDKRISNFMIENKLFSYSLVNLDRTNNNII